MSKGGRYLEAKIVPVLEAVDGAVAAAKAAYPGADCVVPLTHQDMQDDVALAKKGVFPLVLGGHDHGRFSEEHEGCHVIKAGEDAKHVVIVDLFWPADAPKGAKPEVSLRFKQLAPPKKAKKGQPAGPEWTPEYLPDADLLKTTEHWMAPAKVRACGGRGVGGGEKRRGECFLLFPHVLCEKRATLGRAKYPVAAAFSEKKKIKKSTS